MKVTLWVLLIAIVSSTTGCGWVKGLRRDLEDDESQQAVVDEMEYYRDPANRYVPPPPANVADQRTSIINGTPLDLSGVRAKNLRVKAENFWAESVKNENSLWNGEGQSNHLFAQNKLKMPGDLVTISIEDALRKDMVNSVRKLLPPEHRDADIRVPGLTKDTTADQRAPAGAQTPAAPAAAASTYDDLLTAEVLERYPNGNVRIRGIKRVPFKRQVRNIEVLAIVRGADIDEADTVKSSKFFEHRVELYR